MNRTAPTPLLQISAARESRNLKEQVTSYETEQIPTAKHLRQLEGNGAQSTRKICSSSGQETR